MSICADEALSDVISLTTIGASSYAGQSSGPGYRYAATNVLNGFVIHVFLLVCSINQSFLSKVCILLSVSCVLVACGFNTSR